MKLVAGLGNPGSAYRRHRHNVGFMAVDAIAEWHGFGPFRSHRGALEASGRIEGCRVLLVKPQTFMNESGRPIGAILRYHRLAPEDLVVIHDEIDLAPGRVRVKSGGGIAGHNGLRSIRQHVGDRFDRIRIGVGHPGDRNRVTGHVLGDFRAADADWRDPVLQRIAEALPLLLRGEAAPFAGRVGGAPAGGGASSPGSAQESTGGSPRP